MTDDRTNSSGAMSSGEGADGGVDRLFETVVAGGYCVGCGACAAARPDAIDMGLDGVGRLRAERRLGGSGDAGAKPRIALPVLDVCPFSERAATEDELAASLYPDLPHHRRLGRVRSVWAGHVAEDEYRERGSSGGMGSWLIAEQLRAGLADAVVHVRPRERTADDPRMVEYRVSRTAAEIAEGAKSRYHPIELSGVVDEIRSGSDRFVFVGIPCFVKALRLLQARDAALRDRVVSAVGLFCGHLKSVAFAEMFAWQLGVPPDRLRSFDYRVALEGRPASRYGVRAEGVDAAGELRARTAPTHSLFGFNWGHGFFKYKACDYCDDVVGELADASVGDAWLPRYVPDHRGDNVLIVRSGAIDELVRSAVAAGRLGLEPASEEDVVASQSSGFAHRHEGLAYRLAKADARGDWRPPKRIRPDAGALPRRRRRLLDLRERLVERSHEAFAEAKRAGDFGLFRRRMEPLVRSYEAARRPGGPRAVLGRGKRLLKRLLGR